MTRKEMLIKIIQKYGSEHKYTIEFIKAKEWMGTYALSVFWHELMYNPSDNKDEDE